MKHPCLFGLVFLLLGCKPTSPVQSGNHLIDLVTIKENPGILMLSDLAKQIEYIPLETSPGVLLGSIRFCLGKDFIYVLARDQRVLLFDRKGRFVRTIGAKGKGPGEYTGAQEIRISQDGTLIYLYSTAANACFVYTVKGDLQSHFDLAYPSWRFAPLGTGKHLMIAPYGDFTFAGNGKFLFYIQDSAGSVIRKYPSGKIIPMGGDFSIGRFFVTPLSILAYQPFIDTVFRVDHDGYMSPGFVLNFGKYRIPDESFNDFSVLQQNQFRFITSINLVESEPGVFISFACQNELHTGFYDFKHSASLVCLSHNGMVINNIDGGPDFFPLGSDGKKELYSLLQPVELIIQKKDGVFENKKILSQPGIKTFAKVLNSLKEDDNPVLMIVTLK